jgi:hypothetical protein
MPLTQVQGGMILPSTTLTTPIVATTMGVGGATPSTSGSGITFPATQSASTNANTLDDYEEGTWTPVVTFNGASVGQSYSNQTGTYTKIGNQVFLSAIVIMTNKGSSTGAAYITGVPFNENGAYGTGWMVPDANFTGSINTNGFGTYAIIAGSAIYLRYTTSAGGYTNVDNSNFTNNSQIYLTLFYRTA